MCGKQERGNRPEEWMRIMAEALGEEMFCFIFDYITRKGDNMHGPFYGGGRDPVEVARRIKAMLEEQGNTVSAIVHFPGFHTSEELTTYGEREPKVPFQFLYVGKPVMAKGCWMK